ncbi:unnamed protein product [Paramecium octaurelia]|uniref:Uncharacterized protein n=1 Tax=Paramecium octaurelia TaxID=43137 RepID=A0A8S1YCB7_PAROT|nr:unnamed protein product [Paramecium octaurelia]
MEQLSYNQTMLTIIVQALVTKPIQIPVIFLDLPQLKSDQSCPLDFDY